MKRPAFQFYPADWRKDPALSSCSICARGLWIELLCVAHESDDYGHLTVNGLAMNDAQIARAVGESPSLIKKLLAELERAGVFSRDSKGAVFSRRMERDERLRTIRAECGKLGGNPKLLGQKDKQDEKQDVIQTDNQSLTPSVSSSSSSSPLEEASPLLSGKPDALIRQRKKNQLLLQRQASATALLEFLNARSGKNFKPVAANIDPIIARFAEGFTEIQIRQVIVMKCRKWKGDEKMDQYLRPDTLFNRTKFANYVGELVPVEVPRLVAPEADEEPPSAA